MAMHPTRRHVSFRTLVWATVVIMLMATGNVAVVPRAHAQAQGSVFFTVAAGTVTIGAAAPAWYAARITVQPGEPVVDPAAGTEGFVLATDGPIVVADGSANQVTLLQPGSALFVPASAALAFTATEGETSVWRIAVVSADDGAPLIEGDGVTSPLSTTGEADPAAAPKAVRAIELRLGALGPGESVTLGEDGWAVPLVTALAGEGVLGDGSTVAEGRIVARSDGATSVEVSADTDPAVIGYIAMSPSLDLDAPGGGSTTSGTRDDGNRQSEIPASPSVNNAGNDGSTSPPQPTEEPTETAPDTSDADDDGLTADEEAALGTNPSRPDSDDDGLNDGHEVNDYATNPLALDTDGDGVTDGDEVSRQYGVIDPTNADTDYDGLSDGDELFLHHTDPVMSDTDTDGLGDADDPDPLVLTDRDGDLLGDGLEAYYGTNPDNPDSDEDQLSDTYELFTTGTDPNRFDTDGDGTGDAVENASGTDPFDPASHP
jgi:hypothetical protein